MTPMFSYKDCRFSVRPDKFGTGRVVVWSEMKVTNSFTLETSFHGYRDGELTKVYGETELEELGVSCARALLKYAYLLKSLDKELTKTHG